jgi:hypothetical protein
MLTGRGIFDKETRRKPLVLAGDAPHATLYMEIECSKVHTSVRHLFALQGPGRHREALLCPKCGGEWKKIHAVPNTRSVPRASGFVLVAKPQLWSAL